MVTCCYVSFAQNGLWYGLLIDGDVSGGLPSFVLAQTDYNWSACSVFVIICTTEVMHWPLVALFRHPTRMLYVMLPTRPILFISKLCPCMFGVLGKESDIDVPGSKLKLWCTTQDAVSRPRIFICIHNQCLIRAFNSWDSSSTSLKNSPRFFYCMKRQTLGRFLKSCGNRPFPLYSKITASSGAAISARSRVTPKVAFIHSVLQHLVYKTTDCSFICSILQTACRPLETLMNSGSNATGLTRNICFL